MNNRRQFLKTSGAVLSLPFLPSLAWANKQVAQEVSKKLCILYIPNGINRRGFFPGEENGILPGFVGGFNSERSKMNRVQNEPGIYPLELTQSMKPLAKVKNSISLITGLDRLPHGRQDVHEQASSAYLSSLNAEMTTELGQGVPQSRTLDHIIADQIKPNTAFKTLELSTNGFTAPKEPPMFNNISWYSPGKVAPSIKNPVTLYKRLFMSNAFKNHIGDVTSLLLADSKRLARRLGKEDQVHFATYMETIRDIEIRIERLNTITNRVGTKEPVDEILPRGEYIRVMMDLMISAFQSGMTNISTFMFGPERWDVPLMYEGVFDRAVNHHSLTHNQKGDGYLNLIKVDEFHMEQFAYMVERMKSIKEIDGSSLLDNTLVTYGAGLGDGATHQSYDLPMIIAGGTKAGIARQGRFIKTKSSTQIGELWLNLAQMMGCNIQSYAGCKQGINFLKES